MSSTASASVGNTSTTPSTSGLKRKSKDIGWLYGTLLDEANPEVVKCNFCPKVVRAGIYRLKNHIAGNKGVTACPSAPPEAQEKCREAIEEAQRVKLAWLERDQEARDEVQMETGEDDTIEDISNTEVLDRVGGSTPRSFGPMDKFTMPMKPSTLANTKMMKQQKITEKIWKERLHILQRFIAKWLYMRGKMLFHCSFNSYIELFGFLIFCATLTLS